MSVIDTDNLKDRYLVMNIPDDINIPKNGLNIQVKIESEGIVLDLFGDDEEPIASTYKFWNEFEDESDLNE